MDTKHQALAHNDQWLSEGDWSKCCAFMVYITNE
jgi:hypothetical protein